jgi:hypothetical protein
VVGQHKQLAVPDLAADQKQKPRRGRAGAKA